MDTLRKKRSLGEGDASLQDAEGFLYQMMTKMQKWWLGLEWEYYLFERNEVVAVIDGGGWNKLKSESCGFVVSTQM